MQTFHLITNDPSKESKAKNITASVEYLQIKKHFESIIYPIYLISMESEKNLLTLSCRKRGADKNVRQLCF